MFVAFSTTFEVVVLFAGKEPNVSIFECTPAKTDRHTRPTDSELLEDMARRACQLEPFAGSGAERPREVVERYADLEIVPPAVFDYSKTRYKTFAFQRLAGIMETFW